MIRVTLKRSAIGTPEKQRKILKALGLRKIGATVLRRDDEAVRGMIYLVSHLVAVEKAD